MTIHVVTDMCYAYPLALHIKDAVKAHLRWAMQRGDGIIFLKHNDYAVLDELLELVSGYDHCVRIPKTKFSGAQQVKQVCSDKHWPTDEFDVTGVETYCCVLETVEELHRLFPGAIINVIIEGVNDKVCAGRLFPQHPNIRWVRQSERFAGVDSIRQAKGGQS